MHLYNPLKIANFAISKDGRLREPKLLKLEARTALGKC